MASKPAQTLTPQQQAAANLIAARPNKPQWQCEVGSQPKDAKGFTVGELFTIDCQGTAMPLKAPLKIELPEKDHHVVVLVKPLAVTEGKISYEATSYRVGEFSLPYLDFVDADGRGFISNPMKFKTVSVIDPKNPPQSPYGPIQPMRMEYPAWLWFSLAVGFLVLVAWFLIFFRRRIQRKNLEKNIKRFQSPMGSYHQFSKDVRTLKRNVVFSPKAQWLEMQKQDYLQKLEEAYRLFILREYIVPADRWPTKMVLKHMKRKDKTHYDKYAGAAIKAFHELERARTQAENISPMDVEQITGICSQAVESMWKSRRAGGNRQAGEAPR
jgi:hypothetical protein